MKLSFLSCLSCVRLAVAALIGAWCLPCMAGEVAVLRNGFSIRHERHQEIGTITRMYVSADGSSYVDVPTAEIEHFEEEEASPVIRPMAPPMVRSESHPTDLNDLVNQASGRYRLDPDLVNSVIKAESGFNVRAVSPKGAQGLMQLMPGTASELGVPNAFDPQANVDGGARYLRELLERYNFDLVKALAAYNAGTKRVEQYGGLPPYYETRAYVRRIVLDFNRKKLAQKAVVASKKSTNSGTRVSTAKAKVEAKASLAQASE